MSRISNILSMQSDLIESEISSEEIRNEDESSHSNILCLFQKCNKLAAASYNIFTLEVNVLESSENYRPDYILLGTILSLVKPQKILVNTNAHQDILKQIQNYAAAQDCSYQRLKPAFFNYANCKELIYDANFLKSKNKVNYISSVINTSDERLICAIGALFAYLKENFPIITQDRSTEIRVNSVSPMSFTNVVWMDNETYKCLQIFDALQHPSGFKWSNQSTAEKSKGLSVYSIIEKHCCLLGSAKLRNFLSSPTKDIIELKKRHEVIKFCNSPENSKIVASMKSQITYLSPVYVLMGNVECANVRGKHWKAIYQNIYYSVLLAETCKENSEVITIFKEIADSITDEMYAVAYHLDRIIDFQSMEGNELFVVKPGVCDSLEEAKRKYSKLMYAINKIVPYEFDSLPDYIKKIHMLYLPEMKFLLSIPYWKKTLNREELEIPGLEYKFTSNKTAYYKTKRCYELDNLLGDPQIEIMSEEANIIRALGKYIRKHIHHTYVLIQKIAELDCIFSLAAVAKEYDFNEPVLINSRELKIVDGVHPLMKIYNNDFIPNSIESNPQKSLVKIIYGPNSSGKTVYLKQIALLVYLVHLGSYIPAKEAQVGMFSHILTRLSSTESIVSDSSSFMNDIRKLSSLINISYPTSLLILDEVGKGTTELNAVAILASCLNYFLSLGAESPHVLVSSHLTSVSSYINPESNMFSIQVMDYTIEDDKFIFLYTVKEKARHLPFAVESSNFPELPDIVSAAANRVLCALRGGEGVTPYTVLRLRKCQSYYNFLEKFSKIDTNKKGLIEKLRAKLKLLMT